MSLTQTTLASALAITDTKMTVASATGFAARSRIVIDGEVFYVANSYVSGTSIPFAAEKEGTVRIAHPTSAKVLVGLPSDTEWSAQAPQTSTQYAMAGKGCEQRSYSAAGAIEHPKAGADMLAVINGTDALAMTVAAPSKALDGSVLTIKANGKAAHTVTVDGSVGIGDAGSSYNVVTYLAGGIVGIQLEASNGFWIVRQSGATNTNIVPTIT